MGCLIYILIPFFIVLLVFSSILRHFFRALFGKRTQNSFGNKQTFNQNRQSTSEKSSENRSSSSYSYHRNHTQKGKVFGDDEGEYVDFEEVKEDNK